MESDAIDEIIEKACGRAESGHLISYADLRAVAEAAYKKGCEDTVKDVSDADLVAQMIRRGHIKISHDGIAEEGA